MNLSVPECERLNNSGPWRYRNGRLVSPDASATSYAPHYCIHGTKKWDTCEECEEDINYLLKEAS